MPLVTQTNDRVLWITWVWRLLLMMPVFDLFFILILRALLVSMVLLRFNLEDSDWLIILPSFGVDHEVVTFA